MTNGQVSPLLSFVISVTVPGVHHESRSVSANMLLVTWLLEKNITITIHFDFVQPMFSCKNAPINTKHLPVYSDIFSYILERKKVLAKVKGITKKDKITYLSFFFL